MQILITTFVLLHILSWAAAFGIWVAAVKTKQPNKGMSHAAAAAPVFGLIAAVLTISSGWSIDHVTVGIKFVVAVLVAVAAFIAVRKQENTPAWLWFAIPVGIVLNAVIAMY